MSKSRLVSGKVKTSSYEDLDSTRFDFLDLSNAEPNLGLPENDGKFLAGNLDGTRFWTDPAAGFAGSQGFTGSIGFTGSQGELGFTGSQGAAGGEGSLGFSGSQGDQGFTGSQGDTGFVGSQGLQGFTGSIGFTGSVGFTGSGGFVGSGGTPGFTGSRGTNGNRSVMLAQDGLLIVREGAVRWYAPADLTISQITFRLNSSADQDCTIVVRKNGVSTRTLIMPTSDLKVVNTIPFSMVEDEYLTVDVTTTGSPGSTTQGSGLNVLFLYQFTNL